MKTVLVLFGGKSSEYKVSLSSATGVLSNINYNKYNVLCAGITKDGRFFLDGGDLKKIADDTWEEAEKYPLSIDLSTGTAVVSRESGCEHIKIYSGYLSIRRMAVAKERRTFSRVCS